jgi:hypothetical protein
MISLNRDKFRHIHSLSWDETSEQCIVSIWYRIRGELPHQLSIVTTVKNRIIAEMKREQN